MPKRDEFEETIKELDESPEKVIEEIRELDKKKSKDNTVYTSFLETPEYILEQIMVTTHTTSLHYFSDTEFIIFNKETGTIDKKKEITINNIKYKPIVSELLENNVILLPSGIEDYKDTNEIINEIKNFLFSYFEVPRFFENFLPYLVLFYWVYEKFPFIPYVQFLGRTGTGKTTAMEVLGSVCYKPIDASGAITAASIFRIASQWRGTLMLDEFNPGGESYREMLALLKSGVSNKAVLRVEGDKQKEVKAYMVKSPKIFTSEKPVNEAGLRSRIIEIMMEQNKRRVPLYRQSRFLEEAEHIRNKLLLWRLRNLNKIDLSNIEYGYEELQSFQGRVQQVITPIYFMADDIAKKEILQFAQEQQEETFRERRETIEGQIFEIIFESYNRNLLPTISSISESINHGVKFPVSEKKIGSLIRKMLGFEIRRLGDQNISTVILEKKEDLIKQHCKYYGIEFLPKKSNERATPEDAEKLFNDEVPF